MVFYVLQANPQYDSLCLCFNDICLSLEIQELGLILVYIKIGNMEIHQNITWLIV